MTSVAVLTEQETGCKDMGFGVDKHLKLNKPLITVYMSTEACPIKVVDRALSIKADGIAIETAKTGKVTAVVTVMSIFCKNKLQRANPGNVKSSCQKVESSKFLGKNPMNQETCLKKQD
jgi:hypothetical protein